LSEFQIVNFSRKDTLWVPLITAATLSVISLNPINTLNPLLTNSYNLCILMHIIMHITWEELMRTTLNIEDELLDKAAKLTGIQEKTSLVRLGLEALIARESSKRLAKLGGTEKKLETIPRRRAGST